VRLVTGRIEAVAFAMNVPHDKKGSGGRIAGKRVLEPLFTSSYVHVPHLAAKLDYLYVYHPFIKTQKELARALKVQSSTITTWKKGTEHNDPTTIAVVNPESIPTKYYGQVLGLWNLPAGLMELADLSEFKNTVATYEAGRGPWDRLVREVRDDDTIELIGNATRGLIDPDDLADVTMPQFRAGDGIMLRVAKPGTRHAVMLLQDRVSWSCLRPNPRRRESTEIDAELVFPRQIPGSPPRFAEVSAIGGIYRVIVILTQEPLPKGVMDILLSEPMNQSSLNQVVPVLQNWTGAGSKKGRLLGRSFLVLVRAAQNSGVGIGK
jgi:hypothetical protein